MIRGRKRSLPVNPPGGSAAKGGVAVRIVKAVAVFLVVLLLPTTLLPFDIGIVEAAAIALLAIIAGFITYRRTAPKGVAREKK